MECVNEKDSFVVEQSLSTMDILRSKGLLSETDQSFASAKADELVEWHEKVAEEKEKWDALDEVQKPTEEVNVMTEEISFEEALEELKTKRFESSSPKLVRPSKLSKLINWLFRPKPLKKKLLKEQELVFNITKVSLDNEYKIHCRVLQTIYKKLTQSRHNYPRFGHHWEEVGFQGNDPATDLRGTGYFALMQLLFLVSAHLPAALEMYRLSIDPIHNFPFCLVSINVTRIAVQALREEKLSDVCNKQMQVVKVVNDFYLATFWHFYTIWKQERKTMSESGYVIKNVEKHALKHATLLLKSIPKIVNQTTGKKAKIEPISFTRLSTGSDILESAHLTLQPIKNQPQLRHDDTFTSVMELVTEEVQDAT